jgi:two-component system cell cycle sensor histidine kinase/response regulator CckA
MGGDDDTLRRAIFEHAQDAMLLIDDASIVLDANAAAVELFGRSRAELVGATSYVFAVEADRAACEAWLTERREGRAAWEGAFRGEMRIERPDGSIRLSEYVLSGGIAPGRHLVVHRDVTERRAREGEAERYRVLWQRARDICLFIGRGGRLLDANDAAIEAYGYSRDELLGMTVHDLRAMETRTDVERKMEEAFTTGTLFETIHVRKDGSRMPVEVGSRATTLRGERLLLSVIRDISERKQMQARLVQADRLASVGTLAAGVAHEINNPLTYAMASLEVALRVLRESAGSSDERSARAIVRDLKTFARTDEDVVPVDVRAVIDSCIDVAQHELRSGVRLVRAYRDVPRVPANEGRLAQVFLNLIVNAAHAVRSSERGHGTIRIETDVDGYARVVVRITDDGTGIPPEMMSRIFDAFVTTKRAGEGTGLGLYLSRSIVSALGGEIVVESTPGKGASFVITLPSTRVPAPPAERTTSSVVPLRRARIRVVDDEHAIGTVLHEALESEHDLVVLTSGEAALEWLRSDSSFDVVLTDVSMHGMTGIDLLEHIRATHPLLAPKVVLMTGGAMSRATHDPALAGVPILDKPFAVESLRRAIGRALAR